MPYSANDTSIALGQPIECFRFVSEVGEWLYTNADTAITLNFFDFEPTAIIRDGREVSWSIFSVTRMGVMVPLTTAMGIALGNTLVPSDCTVEVWRGHRQDNLDSSFEKIWEGKAVNYTNSGLYLQIDTVSAGLAELQGDLNTVWYQTTCNHDLYDTRCKVVEAAHTTTSTITVIGPTAVTVANDGVADADLKAGQIIIDRTGERRTVLTNLVNVLQLQVQFDDVILGDAVTMVKGCNHVQQQDCINKFSNAENFGGFLYIPEKNPYSQGDRIRILNVFDD